MNISAVKRVGRSRRYQILVDEAPVLEVDEEVIAQFGLTRGRVLEEESLAEIQRADQALLTSRAALRLLKVRARSRQELTRSLRSKQFDPEAIRLTLERLESVGLINDELLAGSLARQLRDRRLGSHLVRQKMLRAGLDRELTEATLASLNEEAEEDGEESELERAVAQAEKYVRRSAGDPPDQARRRLYSFLARRGFDSEVCRLALEQTVPDSD